MCEFRHQVERQNCYLERYSPKGSCHLVEPTWVTHLLRIAFRTVEMQRILRAKQQRHLKIPELPSWVLNGLKCGSFGWKKLVEKANGWSRQDGSWVGHVPWRKIKKVQVRFHPHVVWSSLARTDNHGFLAPCETTKHVSLYSLIGKFDRIEVLHLFRCFTNTHVFIRT